MTALPHRCALLAAGLCLAGASLATPPLAAPLAAPQAATQTAPLAETPCTGRPAKGGAPLVDAVFRDAALQALQRLVVQAPQLASHGAIRTHIGTGFVDAQGQPWQQVSAYAVNLGLLGVLNVAPALLPVAADWLRWQARHVAASGPQRGVVPDHWVRSADLALAMCPPGLAAERCGDVDAVDSTAASTLLLADAYQRQGGAVALLREPAVRAALESAAMAMTLLTDSDGLTLAKRSHPVVYTMDAVEVIAGWRAWARLQRDAYAQPQSALNSDANAERAEAGLRAQLWDAQAGAWRVHSGDEPLQRQRWYPDTVAQAWPLLWGANAGPPGRAAQAWRQAQQPWLKPHWASRIADPAGFWWPAAAVAALCTGDEAAARTWVARARLRWLDPRAPFAWPFQVSDLLWLLWLAEPPAPQPPGLALATPSTHRSPIPGDTR